MNRLLTKLGIAFALATTIPACVFSASGRVRTRGVVVVQEAPPAPKEERWETRDGYVWVRGNWEYRGNRYVWVPGHYERVRANYEWSDGRWEQQSGGGWVWVKGEWRTGGGGDRPKVVDHRDNGGGNDDRPKVRDHRDNGGGNDTTVVIVGPTSAPPEIKAENPGSNKGYIWIRGNWQWTNGQWEWVAGHWERPKAKHRWRDGYWEVSGNTWVWVDGDWEAEAESDRPKVRDHRK